MDERGPHGARLPGGLIVNAYHGMSIPSLLDHLRRVMAELRELGRQVPG